MQGVYKMDGMCFERLFVFALSMALLSACDLQTTVVASGGSIGASANDANSDNGGTADPTGDVTIGAGEIGGDINPTVPTDPNTPVDTTMPPMDNGIFPAEAGIFLGKPSVINTGLLDARLLKPAAAMGSYRTIKDGVPESQIIRDGATIENMDFSGAAPVSGGAIQVLDLRGVKNVTIRNCRINGQNGGSILDYGINVHDPGTSNIKIEHVEIYNVKSAGIFGDSFVARYLDIHHSAGDGIKPGVNAIIAFSWIHHLGYNSPLAHADGIQIAGGNNIRMYGNFFDMGNNVPNTKSNSGAFIQGGPDGKTPASNLMIMGNWVLGGTYGLRPYSDHGKANTIQVLSNRFVMGSFSSSAANIEQGVIWKNNVSDQTSLEIQPSSK